MFVINICVCYFEKKSTKIHLEITKIAQNMSGYFSAWKFEKKVLTVSGFLATPNKGTVDSETQVCQYTSAGDTSVPLL